MTSIRSVHIRAVILIFLILLAGCKGQLTQPPERPVALPLIYEDSTVYFADNTASLSMRASFESDSQSYHQTLTEGYKFQFRSIQKRNILISQVSIISGGEKINVSTNRFLLPPQQGITLSLSLEDTRRIAQQDEAILRFKYEGDSQLMSIKAHRLLEWTTR